MKNKKRGVWHWYRKEEGGGATVQEKWMSEMMDVEMKVLHCHGQSLHRRMERTAQCEPVDLKYAPGIQTG